MGTKKGREPEMDKLYHKLVDLASDGLWLLDRRFLTAYVNPALEQLLGYTKEEMFGRSWSDFGDPAWVARAKELEHRCEQGIREPHEFLFNRKDGRKILTRIATTPFCDAAGNFDGVIGVLSDITGQKEAAALAPEVAMLARTEAISHTGSWRLEPATGKVAWSEEMYRIFGLDRKAFTHDVAQAIALAVHPEDRERLAELNAAVLKDGLPRPVEYRIVRPDGAVRWVYAQGEQERDSAGRVAALTGFVQDITERKQAEAALLASHDRMAAILSSMEEAIFLVNPQTHGISECNDATARMFGYSREELAGRDTSTLHVDQGHFERFGLAAMAAHEDPGYYAAEFEMRRKDGTVFPAECFLRPVLDRSNKVLYVVNVVRDITERKQAEAALALSEARYRSIFEDSPVAVWEEDFSGVKARFDELRRSGVSDFRGYFDQNPGDVGAMAALVRITEVNRRSLELLGADSQEQLSRDLPKYFTAESLPVFREELLALVEGRTLFNSEIPIVNSKGEQVFLDLTLSVQPGSEETLSRVLVTFLDITDRKRAEERLTRLTNQVPGVVYEYRLYPDGRSCFPYSSSGMNDIYEVSPEEVREDASVVFGRIHPDDLKRASDAIFESARTLENFHCELRMVLPGQGLRWRVSRAKPERLPDGGTLWYGIITDITERKLVELEREKLYQELVAKKRELESFLYITTHDLRSPLVNIQGYSHSLREYLAELRRLLDIAPLSGEVKDAALMLLNKRAPEALDYVAGSAVKMDNLIAALLKVARLGRLQPRPENVDMNALLNGILPSLKYRLNAAGGTVEVGPLPHCKADPDLVNQVFSNLLDNAVKYRHPDRKLDISVSGAAPAEGTVVYTVRDNGVGIRAGDLDRIWNVFYRARVVGVEHGEGIGLPMAKRIAEMNGGRIRAESKEGEGSVFFVELPAAGP